MAELKSHTDVEAVPGLMTALCTLLLQAADDDLVIGHRDSEWLGLAPEIEGDIAFSSIAQDEVGHATFLYELAAPFLRRTSDELAFHRAPSEWRNALLLERPNHDWAYTMVRHFIYDQFETVRLEAMQSSAYEPLAEGARKIIREEYYHRVHFDLSFRRLFAGGDEAQERMVGAWRRAVPDIWTLFDFGDAASVWAEHGLLTQPLTDLQHRFLTRMNEALPSSAKPLAMADLAPIGAGRTAHTNDLDVLLTTMAEVHSAHPTAAW